MSVWLYWSCVLGVGTYHSEHWGEGACSVVAAGVCLVMAWREENRQRRELSRLAARVDEIVTTRSHRSKQISQVVTLDEVRRSIAEFAEKN